MLSVIVSLRGPAISYLEGRQEIAKKMAQAVAEAYGVAEEEIMVLIQDKAPEVKRVQFRTAVGKDSVPTDIRTIPAYQVGPYFVVHRDFEDSKRWVIAHLATGRRLPDIYFKTRKQAVAALARIAPLTDWTENMDIVGVRMKEMGLSHHQFAEIAHGS